jgi:capsid protein
MPWLHLIFDAWEDYRRQRALEDEERARQELVKDSLAIEATNGDADESDGGKKKKRKRKK